MVGPRKKNIAVMVAWLLTSTAVAAQSGGSIPRSVLPPPDQPFSGRMGKTVAESVAGWPARVEAPAAAPNILLIMTDDVGFGASSTFGGPIPTPNFDRLAQHGLRYNRFHTTAICSPSRAALLTGRNHHHVGTGMLAESAVGFPGYNLVMPKADAPVAKILEMNGYSTAMFGKHHNVPSNQVSLAGPFDNWPTGLGFDYFFGFVAAESNKWQPRLIRNVTPVDEPSPEGMLLEPRLVDDAIRWIHNQKAADPKRPFFLYFADPSMHAPHQAPAEYIARFKGKFDQGWDKVRQETYQRQLMQGIIPPGTQLSERPSQLPAWDSLSPHDKAYQCRLMEVAAAELAYEDEQIGRLIDEIDRMGIRDNTLVVFVEGDNGAAGEGTPAGAVNETGVISRGSADTPAEMYAAMAKFGGPDSYEAYSAAWAWAMNSPLPWMKQIASHLGGVRNGMVISWPNRIHEIGAIRSQFSHLIDIAPTLLDAAGIPAPDSVDGIKQDRFDGISLTSTFNSNADVPRTQYFEMMGSLGIYKNGWFANTTPRRMPWEHVTAPSELARPRKWELYDLAHDFSQAHDIADQQPAKLRELQETFDAEARRNQVYPIKENFISDPAKGAAPVSARSTYDFWGADTTLLFGTAPSFAGRSFTIAADVTIKESASGVILADGSQFAGWSFFLDQGRPVVVEALSEKPGGQVRIEGGKPLAPGNHRIRFAFASDGGYYAGGSMRIEVDGSTVAEERVPKTILMTTGESESLDIGRDTGVPVTKYHTPQGTFEGTIEHVQLNFPVGEAPPQIKRDPD